MADFNLSAEIALNLAQGAIANLKKQIQTGFNAPLEVADTKAAVEKVKKTKKKIESEPIVVPIEFESLNAKDQYKGIVDKLKPIPIEVAFSPKSVRNDLSTAALKRLIGERKITVPIGVSFDKATTKKLDQIKAQIKELSELRDKFEGALSSRKKADAPTDVPEINITSNASQLDNQVQSLIERLKALKVQADAIKSSGGSLGNDFFGLSSGSIDKLMSTVGSAEELSKRFAGLNDANKENLEAAIKTIFRATLNLDKQRNKLNALKAQFGDGFNIKPSIELLDKAQDEINNLFATLDSSVPTAFSAGVQNVLSQASQATSKFVSSSTRDLKAYDNLLKSLKNQSKELRNNGANKEQLTNIQKDRKSVV